MYQRHSCYSSLVFLFPHKRPSVQLLSSVWLIATPWTAACQASLSPTPRVYSNSCPLSRCCHPAISSSVVPFSSPPSVFPSSRSFQMSQLFPSGGQSIGVSALALVLPMNIQDWFPLRWTGWISLHSQESSPTPQFKNINSSALNFLNSPILTSIHDHWKNRSFD